MTDNAPERPEILGSAISAVEFSVPDLPPHPPATPQRGLNKRALIATGAIAVLLLGGGVTWWALKDDGDVLSHVDVSGGKFMERSNDNLDAGEKCDDTDEYSYNDCYADSTYEFVYKITNDGDEYANYGAIVNGFNKDGEFVGQTYVNALHLAPGKSDADKGEFGEYSDLADGRSLKDIASVKVAHVQRTALAN
ncbi:hypothetical protein [Streptomyces acidiscabies]|uniref:hypothetical protein n=1 Tax=Streptomyces acidiscabies TaxID=42234 RepID=UPI0009518932|nr:hypothetical protein [Streptomyces acidiscabies]